MTRSNSNDIFGGNWHRERQIAYSDYFTPNVLTNMENYPGLKSQNKSAVISADSEIIQF